MDMVTKGFIAVFGGLLFGVLSLFIFAVIASLFGWGTDDKVQYSSKEIDTGYRVGGQKVTQEINETTYSPGTLFAWLFLIGGFCPGFCFGAYLMWHACG